MVFSTWSCVLHSPEEKQAPNPMCRDKACCWSRKNFCRELFVGLRKLGFCRLWNFLGNPSQKSVEWTTSGVCWHLNLIFLKCVTQAVVSSSAGSTELFPLLPPQHNLNVPIFYFKVFFMAGFPEVAWNLVVFPMVTCFSQCIIKVLLGTVACLSIRLIQAANHRDFSTFAVPYLFLLGKSLQTVGMFNFESQISTFVWEGRKAAWSVLNNWHVKEAVSLLLWA